MELEVGVVSRWLLFLKTPQGGSGGWSHGCPHPALGQRHKPRGSFGQVPSLGELRRWPGRCGGVRASEARCRRVPSPPSVFWHPDHLPTPLCTPLPSPRQASSLPRTPSSLLLLLGDLLDLEPFILKIESSHFSRGPTSPPFPWEPFLTLPL